MTEWLVVRGNIPLPKLRDSGRESNSHEIPGECLREMFKKW